MKTGRHGNVLSWQIMMNIHGKLTKWKHHSYMCVIDTLMIFRIIVYSFITMITIMVLCNIRFSLLLVSSRKHQLPLWNFPNSSLHKTMGKWTGQKKKRGSIRMYVTSLSLPVTFCLGHPSLRWDLSSKFNDCLLQVSFFHTTVCFLTQITDYLLVAQRSINKISSAWERGRGRGKQQNDKHKEQRANRQQMLRDRYKKKRHWKKMSRNRTNSLLCLHKTLNVWHYQPISLA